MAYAASYLKPRLSLVISGTYRKNVQHEKTLSLILTFCLSFCLCIPAFAEDVPAGDAALVEEATEYYFWNDDPAVLYVRFSAQIVGVSDAFKAEYLPDPYLADELPPAIGKDDLHIVLPCEENGGRVELFLTIAEYGYDLHLSGLVDAQGIEIEYTVRQEDSENYMFHVGAVSDGNSLLISLYAGELPLKALLTEADFDYSALTSYCLAGDPLWLPELSPALQSRATLTCDGVELSENDDGSYTFVSGTGTVTYTVADHLRATKKICVQTPEERRVFTAKAAAKHPLVTAYFWMTAAFTYPVIFSPVGYVFLPASVLLGLVTLPLSYLVQVLALRYWM